MGVPVLKSLLWLSLAGISTAQTTSNLLQDGSFQSLDLTQAWSLDPGVARNGSITLSPMLGGSLKLVPNGNNPVSSRLFTLYGVAQGVSAAGLQGQSLYLSARMLAEGDVTAILRVVALGLDGSATVQEIEQPASSQPMYRRDIIRLPSNPLTYALVIFCQVSGTSGSAYFNQVSLVPGIPPAWNEATGQPDPGPPFFATVNVDAGSTLRRIPETLFGSNLEWIWDGDGVWNAEANTLDPTVMRLTRDAGLTLHRFPGGLFADYYFWRNAVGPQESRPATNAFPGGPFSMNRFGTDEALAFADQTNSRLMITVNVLTSTPADAADWVRYVNGNKHRVDYWEIGNENYVPGPASLTAEDYANRFLQFARAMRAVDPNIVVGAIADENFSLTATQQYPDWTERVVRIAGNEIDFLSVHCAYAPALYKDMGWDSRTVYAATLAAPQIIARRLNDLAQRLDALTPGRSAPIQIAVTEWGPFFQTDPGSRFVDHSKTLASALYAASTLKSFMESPRTQVANFFKLVDTGFMGWIGLRQGTYTAKVSLLAIGMFRNWFGPDLVRSTTVAPSYDAPTVGWVDSAAAIPYLEIVAARSADSRTLYVLGINKHFDRDIQANIHVSNFSMSGSATVYTLNGTAADANTGTELPGVVKWATQSTIGPNSRFQNGGPTEVGIIGSTLSNVSGDFVYTFPAHSVTSIVLVGQ